MSGREGGKKKPLKAPKKEGEKILQFMKRIERNTYTLNECK